MQKNTLRYFASVMCGFMFFLWSGSAQIFLSVAHASELQTEFNKQRQTVRSLELIATDAMYAAAPACDVFENKLAELMAGVAPKISTVPTVSQQQLNLNTRGTKSNLINADNLKVKSENGKNIGTALLTKNVEQKTKESQEKLSDKPIQLNDQVTAKTMSAKELGLDPEVASIIDNSPELSNLFKEAYFASLSCKPLYAKLADAEANLNSALNQWIELANKINSNSAMGPRLEASGMWVAVKIRRATRMAMHTTIPDLTDKSICVGDVFTNQSIPNLFQGLANGDPSFVIESISEIIQQSQCIDIQQSVALDRGFSMGAVASILAFNSAADIPIRKHLLEALVMAGAPILEANKVLGPTGLWILTQTLLIKEISHPDIWVLGADSFLVNYGITVPSRETAQAVTLPICSEEAPPITSASPPKVPAQIDKNLPSLDVKKKKGLMNSIFDFTSFFKKESAPLEVIAVDPEEAPLAYGYSIKDLKAGICPVIPEPKFSAVNPPAAGTINKGGIVNCYKAKEITDSNRGDHLGYATCSLPEMMANGYVCKTILCDPAKSSKSGMPVVGNPFGGEMPAVTFGSGCGYPAVQGIPPECQMAGKSAKVFANYTSNSGCGDVKQLNFVADAPVEPVYEASGEYEIVVVGKAPEDSQKPKVLNESGPKYKTETERIFDIPSSNSTNKPPTSVAGGTVVKKLPEIPTNDAAKEAKFFDEMGKGVPGSTAPVPQQGIITPFTTKEEFLDGLMKLESLKFERDRVVRAIFDENSKLGCFQIPPLPICESQGHKDKLEELLKEKAGIDLKFQDLALRIAISAFRLEKPIIDDESLQEAIDDFNQLRGNIGCPLYVCRAKIEDMKNQIVGSDYFKKKWKKGEDDAREVMKNKEFKKAMKDLREKMLGRPIDNEIFDIAYEGMLSASEFSTIITYDKGIAPYVSFGSNIVFVPISLSGNIDSLVNVLIHEYSLHVLSQILGLYGYDLEENIMGKGNEESYPDHQLGIQLQGLTGISMGYKAPPQRLVQGLIYGLRKEFYYDGYKKYLPNDSSNFSGVSENLGGITPGGSSQSGGNSGGNNSGSGGSQVGGTPDKSCAPDSPNCGPLNCQLVTLSAAAKCDMASGKKATKLLPGEGVGSPQEPKLDKATSDWLACLFPGSSSQGGVDCPNMNCGPGVKATKDPNTGQCTCNSAKGDPSKGFMGGKNECAMIVCAEGSTHPCCISPAAKSGFIQDDAPYQKNLKQMPDQRKLPNSERGPDKPPF